MDPTAALSPIQKDVYKEMFSFSGQYSLNVGIATDFLAPIDSLGPILRIKPKVVLHTTVVPHTRVVPNRPSMRTPYETQTFSGPLHAHLDSMSYATLTARPRPPAAMLPAGRTEPAVED